MSPASPVHDVSLHNVSEQEEQHTSNAAPTKRRRTNRVSKIKSCAECRRLKLRCNRQTPCDNCTRRGTGSICPNGALKTAPVRNLILESQDVLQDRIAALEKALSEREAHPSFSNVDHLEDDDDGTPTTEDDNEHRLEKRPQAVVRTSAERNPPPAERYLQHEAHFGHLHVHQGDLRSSRFYGDASSLYLAAEDEATEQSQARSTGPYMFSKGWVESFTFERHSALRSEQTLNTLLTQLPREADAERLIGIYFENVSWGSAILDRNVFAEECYQPHYSGLEPNAQKLAVLFFALALGSLFDPCCPAGANNNPLSRDLFSLGRACLALDSSSSLPFVQSVHLMVTWLNNGGSPVSIHHSTWSLLGMAMRVVQTLGLHRDGKHFDLPAAEIAERRRVFWEVFAYDINHSLTSAKPRSMTKDTYDVEFPITEEGGDHYHEVRYRLSELCCKINDQHCRVQPTPYEKVVEIDRELRQFQQQLPLQLNVGELPSSGDEATARKHHVQRYTMQFRINLGIMILHRGWFARALTEDSEEPLRSKYCPSFVGCLEAGKLILNTVRRLIEDAPYICQRRWFFHFHAFTACVCLAATTIRAPQSMLAQSSLMALEEGLELFKDANKRRELSLLHRLRDTARQRFTQSGSSLPSTDEDLELLGKRSSKRLSSISVSPAGHTALSGSPEGIQGHLVSSARLSQVNGKPAISDTALRDMDSIRAMLAGRQPENTEAIPLAIQVTNGGYPTAFAPNSVHISSNGVESDQLFDPSNWDDSGTSGTEFDFDAFLASFGISSTNEPINGQLDLGIGFSARNPLDSHHLCD